MAVFWNKSTPQTPTAKSPRYSRTMTEWKLGRALALLLHHSFCPSPAGKENVLRPTQDLQQAGSQSTDASGKGSRLWQTPWATSLRHSSRRSATRWCGFNREGARTHRSPSMQALAHSSKSRLGSNSTYGLRTGTIWNGGRATR